MAYFASCYQIHENLVQHSSNYKSNSRPDIYVQIITYRKNEQLLVYYIPKYIQILKLLFRWLMVHLAMKREDVFVLMVTFFYNLMGRGGYP